MKFEMCSDYQSNYFFLFLTEVVLKVSISGTVRTNFLVWVHNFPDYNYMHMFVCPHFKIFQGQEALWLIYNIFKNG